MRLLAALCAAALLPASAALAQSAPDCDAPVTQRDMNVCAGEDYEAADAELNAVYAEVMAGFDESEEWDQRRKTALRDAQRHWIAFRDADCREAAGLEWEGGSARPMIELGCMAEKTEQRTETLRGRYLYDAD